jgi:aspartyl-tRNA(Asn)/glutamyl-tRNA(Gln) amidotransferase subunit A
MPAHTSSIPVNSLSQIQSPTARVEASLAAIEANTNLNAFVEVYVKEARALASEQENTPNAGRLSGMIIGVKDVICHAGHGLQAGSQILGGFQSLFTATALERVLAEGAIVIGRQNCDEFAMGSSNENSSFGPVRNAADVSRVSGGSSGGSAVAVQAGMCQVSLGSDTGGSVRQPAAFCGIYGLKPTYGRISRWGLVAYGSSFDCIGPLANNLEDLALLLNVMAGPDGNDSTASTSPVEDYPSRLATKLDRPLRVGVLRPGLEDAGVDPAIRVALAKAIEGLKANGHSVDIYDFDLNEYLLPTYYIITMAEASSNLSRYDGVRYGYRASEVVNLEDMYKRSRSEGFGPEVKRRILLGNYVLTADYFDAYFTKAQRCRRMIVDATRALYNRFDVLLCPTTPTPAFKIGESPTDPTQQFLADIFTVHANLTGQPAINVPAGDVDGLPIGLQLTAPKFEEGLLLQAARQLEIALA